jgi:hypothetical protein
MMVKPIQTAETEYFIDEQTGEVVKIIEHFRQADHFYRIIWEDGKDPVIEDEQPF